MASEEGCATLNWDIRNFSLLLKVTERQYLSSPEWEVEDTKGRVREVWLHVYNYDSEITIVVNGFRDHSFRTEMFFKSPYVDVQLLKVDYVRTWFNLPKSALFDKNGQSILVNDTVTLCCRMWGKELKTSECHIATDLQKLNHLWTFEKLSSSNYHDTYIEKENAKLHVSLKKDKFGYGGWIFTVEGEPEAPGDIFIVDGTLNIKDRYGSVLNHESNIISNRKHSLGFNMDLNITSVTLQLELIVALNRRHNVPASSQVVRETQLKPNSPTNIAKHKNVSGALGDDFLLLYRESALSDATLNTEGKSFSANRFVLAARSPVFRAMFEKDETSEGQSWVLDMDDVDSETVDRMLIYMYADSVGDLAWQEACALYYAADKYEIQPLKEKCADFLKICLATDNACEVLVLADRHSDQELMTTVVDFILGHEEVVSSAQWEELEKSNSMLCAKITRELFLKRGKK